MPAPSSDQDESTSSTQRYSEDTPGMTTGTTNTNNTNGPPTPDSRYAATATYPDGTEMTSNPPSTHHVETNNTSRVDHTQEEVIGTAIDWEARGPDSPTPVGRNEEDHIASTDHQGQHVSSTGDPELYEAGSESQTGDQGDGAMSERGDR